MAPRGGNAQPQDKLTSYTTYRPLRRAAPIADTAPTRPPVLPPNRPPMLLPNRPPCPDAWYQQFYDDRRAGRVHYETAARRIAEGLGLSDIVRDTIVRKAMALLPPARVMDMKTLDAQDIREQAAEQLRNDPEVAHCFQPNFPNTHFFATQFFIESPSRWINVANCENRKAQNVRQGRQPDLSTVIANRANNPPPNTNMTRANATSTIAPADESDIAIPATAGNVEIKIEDDGDLVMEERTEDAGPSTTQPSTSQPMYALMPNTCS